MSVAKYHACCGPPHTPTPRSLKLCKSLLQKHMNLFQTPSCEHHANSPPQVCLKLANAGGPRKPKPAAHHARFSFANRGGFKAYESFPNTHASVAFSLRARVRMNPFQTRSCEHRSQCGGYASTNPPCTACIFDNRYEEELRAKQKGT